LLKKHNFSALAYDTLIPLSLKYKTPKTLGLDRIAASVGALTLFEESNLLVMDMGTCVTFDFISKKKDYLGGAIAPGIQMRLKALHHFTGKLPMVRLGEKKVVEIGKTTEESILSGVYWGMKHEIEGTISRYIQQYEDLKVVITGGDIKLFDFEPKNRIFADEFLVLKGLNEIAMYNEIK
jgi:type III pantothenate kinase